MIKDEKFIDGIVTLLYKISIATKNDVGYADGVFPDTASRLWKNVQFVGAVEKIIAI